MRVGKLLPTLTTLLQLYGTPEDSSLRTKWLEKGRRKLIRAARIYFGGDFDLN